MTIELYLIHLGFIGACVYFSWKAGYKYGRGEMLEDLIDFKLFSLKDLKNKVIGKNENTRN